MQYGDSFFFDPFGMSEGLTLREFKTFSSTGVFDPDRGTEKDPE